MPHPSRGRMVQGVLAAIGLGFFVLLVRRVDFHAIASLPGGSLALLLAAIAVLAAVNYSFDTLSWWLVAGPMRPSFGTLTSIRLRCEAVTNLVPGGAMIGEPMKIALLSQGGRMSRAEAATSFLLSKLVVVCGHIGYIIVGVAFSYSLLGRSSRLATIALAVALTLFLLLTGLLAAMIWVRPLARWLLPSRSESRWSGRWNTLVAELHRVEELIGDAARKGVWRLLAGLGAAFVAWSLNAVEAWLILRWLGGSLSFTDVYAIDAVSSVVRILLFVVPIGLGGQDWAITGLMPASISMSATVVLLKRAREFTVVAIGLMMLAFAARRSGTGLAPAGRGDISELANGPNERSGQ